MQPEDYERTTIVKKPFEGSIAYSERLQRTVAQHKLYELWSTLSPEALNATLSAYCKEITLVGGNEGQRSLP